MVGSRRDSISVVRYFEELYKQVKVAGLDPYLSSVCTV